MLPSQIICKIFHFILQMVNTKDFQLFLLQPNTKNISYIIIIHNMHLTLKQTFLKSVFTPFVKHSNAFLFSPTILK